MGKGGTLHHLKNTKRKFKRYILSTLKSSVTDWNRKKSDHETFHKLFSVPKFREIACFNTGSSLLSDILGDFKSQVADEKHQEVIGACAELAFDKGYKFFALGYNGVCRSGPNARDEYHKEGATSDSNCPNGIGINKRIAVYTFGKFHVDNICSKL